MKISLKWLNEYVDIENFFDKPEELAELITRAGLEVEDIFNRRKLFQNLKVALILEKTIHPNADRLSLCKVTTGEGVVHQIVCGAQNHHANDKVILALPGAELPGGLKIGNSKIRGVESGGMLCSLKELGLATESNGIEILNTDAPVGKDYAEYAGYDDVIFELKVTPNRADCLSHFGLAREVACLLEKAIKEPKFELQEVSQSTCKDKVSIKVKQTELCPRYTGRWIQGVKVGPSPAWLKNRLESVGMSSINNIVDVTNYVMLEMGQPLHAFDGEVFLQKASGQNVIVDLSLAGEKFVTLDGTELTLTGSELMIRDSQQSLCMAGVIGGQNSGVSEQTKEIFLEAALFNPLSVRRSCRKHGIETDSAYRFCRGIDASSVLKASERAAYLISQVAGGQVLAEPFDFYPQPALRSHIDISIQTITDRLGYPAVETKFIQFMKRLGCWIEGQDGKFKVLPPSYRFDLEIEMDLVEEYARLQGYDSIPESLPALSQAPQHHDKSFLLFKSIRQLLRGEGFSESLNLAFESKFAQEKFFTSVQNLEKFGLKSQSTDSVDVVNPLNEEMNIMRQSLIQGLFKNGLANYHHGVARGRLFEVGSVFAKTLVSDKNKEKTYLENQHLGLLSWGNLEQLWNIESLKSENSKLWPLYEMKASLENLLGVFNFKQIEFKQINNRAGFMPFMHWGQASEIKLDGQSVGFLTSVHPMLLDEHKVRVPMVMAEINLDAFIKVGLKSIRARSISKLPAIERDLALVLAKKTSVSDVLALVRASAGPSLVELDIFDHYQGEKMEPHLKSVGIRMKFQDTKTTLSDAQVNEVQAKILSELSAQFNAQVR